MSRKTTTPTPDPLLEKAKQILGNPSFAGNQLLEPYRELAEAYGRTLRIFSKTMRISDGFQRRLKELNAALDEAVRTDYLTGLMNRRAFFERVGPEMSRSRRHERPVCVLMTDIDHFKQVNDSFGHDAGDRVLKETASIFASSLRSEDLTTRWGGEELLALLPETELAGAVVAAEKLRSVIEQSVVTVAGREIRITLSIGVAEGLDEEPEAIIRAADQALLDAKRQGRNRVVVAPKRG